MIQDGELSRMRTEADRALAGTAVIMAGTLSHDGGGGYSDGFTAAGTVSCRIAPMPSRGMDERIEGNRISAEADWIITLPAETTVETDDRIEIGGRTYNVTAIHERTWEVTRRVEATEIE